MILQTLYQPPGHAQPLYNMHENTKLNIFLYFEPKYIYNKWQLSSYTLDDGDLMVQLL